MSGVIVGFATLLVLSLVIFVHEAAHYVVARKAGMKVEEFFLGFGPRMYSWRRGETEYGIKWILFGGYVKIAGMNPTEEVDPADLDRTYGAKSMSWRAAVIVAGPLTHFGLAFVAAFILFAAVGFPAFGPPRTPPLIEQVEPRLNGYASPAEAAGLQPGDLVTSVDGEELNTDEFIDFTRAHPDEVLRLVIQRGEETLEVEVTPVMSELADGELVARIGIVPAAPPAIGRERENPIVALGSAATMVGDITVLSIEGMGKIFSPAGITRLVGQVFGDTPRGQNDAMSVVGVARVAGEVASDGQIHILLLIFIQVNIFVGLLNLLPLPPFDGGHLLFLLIEKIRGRPVDMLKVLPVTAVILVFLVSYMGLVVFLDVFEPIPLTP